ncbi:MAG: tetratricopeptide repeat protein [Deltaproteobacteria bacterium]|nr:tetratricopeptide repeat protein [Deltaproteobacteria bacterium]
MKNTSRLMAVIVAALVAGLVLVPPGAFSATSPPSKAPAADIVAAPQSGGDEIVLRIRDAEGLVNFVESMAEDSKAARKGAVRDTIEQQFGGLDWLDEKRSIVIIGNIPAFTGKEAGGSFTLVGLVPFTKKNEKFRETFSAIEGRGYYLFTHPAGWVMKKATIARLIAASKAKCPDMLALEIPVSGLASGFLERGIPALEASLKKADEKKQGEPEGKAEPLTRQTLNMAKAFYEFLRDVKTTEIGLNADENLFSLRLSSVPVPGSALARAMATTQKTGGKSLLAGYLPEGPITIRTKTFDYGPLMQVLNDLYAKAGIDLSCNRENMARYTGEYVVSVSFPKAGLNIESMLTLKKDGESVEGLVSKWLECSKQMHQILDSVSPQPYLSRTEDTTVAGRKATGISMRMPLESGKSTLFNIRAALSGRILVLAADDKRLAELLAQADKMKPGKAAGPLMEGRIDLAALISGAALMEGAKEADVPELAGTSPLNFTFDIKKGVAETLLWANMKQMRALFSQIEKAAKDTAPKEGGDSWSDIEEDDEDDGEGSRDGHGNGDGNLDEYEDGGDADGEDAQTAGLKPGADELDPRAAALLERGNLALVYGSPEMALRYFLKALKSAPESGQVHSALATAYAESKRFEKALFHIEKALEIVPENPDYLYGRARIHLLSGDEAKARKGFEDAAAKGSDEAKRFLERMKEKP